MLKEKIYQELALNEDEIILKVVRQSWTQLFIKLFLPIILVVGDFFMLFTFFSFGLVGVVIFGSILTLAILIGLRSLVIWYFQSLIITSQKIVDLDQQGLFKKTVSSANLSDIQDVFYETNGPIQAIFKVGDIKFKLNDGKTRIDARNIPQPQKIQKIILQNRPTFTNALGGKQELSQAELIQIIKKVKLAIGEEKFEKIIQDQTITDN